MKKALIALVFLVLFLSPSYAGWFDSLKTLGQRITQKIQEISQTVQEITSKIRTAIEDFYFGPSVETKPPGQPRVTGKTTSDTTVQDGAHETAVPESEELQEAKEAKEEEVGAEQTEEKEMLEITIRPKALEPEKIVDYIPKVIDLGLFHDRERTQRIGKEVLLGESFFVHIKITGTEGHEYVVELTSDFENITETFQHPESANILTMEVVAGGEPGYHALYVRAKDLEESQESPLTFVGGLTFKEPETVTVTTGASIFEPESTGIQELSDLDAFFVMANSTIYTFLPGTIEGVKEMLTPWNLVIMGVGIAVIAIIMGFVAVPAGTVAAFSFAVGSVGIAVMAVPKFVAGWRKSKEGESPHEEMTGFWKQVGPDLLMDAVTSVTGAVFGKVLRMSKGAFRMAGAAELSLKYADDLVAIKLIDDIDEAERMSISVLKGHGKLLPGNTRNIILDEFVDGALGAYEPFTKAVKIFFKNLLGRVVLCFDEVYEVVLHEYLHHASTQVRVGGKKLGSKLFKLAGKVGLLEIASRYHKNPKIISAIENEFFDVINHKLAVTSGFVDKGKYLGGWSNRILRILDGVDNPFRSGIIKTDDLLGFTAELKVMFDNVEDLPRKDELLDIFNKAVVVINKNKELIDDFRKIVDEYMKIFGDVTW